MYRVSGTTRSEWPSVMGTPSVWVLWREAEGWCIYDMLCHSVSREVVDEGGNDMTLAATPPCSPSIGIKAGSWLYALPLPFSGLGPAPGAFLGVDTSNPWPNCRRKCIDLRLSLGELNFSKTFSSPSIELVLSALQARVGYAPGGAQSHCNRRQRA